MTLRETVRNAGWIAVDQSLHLERPLCSVLRNEIADAALIAALDWMLAEQDTRADNAMTAYEENGSSFREGQMSAETEAYDRLKALRAALDPPDGGTS